MKVTQVFLLCCCITFVAAAPEHKQRSYEKHLSDEDHYDDNDEHNVDYDHEAFLGDEAKEFDDLTPEESRAKLAAIYDKIDEDKDGMVTEQELIKWLKHSQTKYIQEDADKQWKAHAAGDQEELTWEEYKKSVYGFTENLDDDEDGNSYIKMIKRDQRRWEVADQDSDGKLSRKEFANFLHPEEVDHMKQIVVMETIEDIDKNRDGKISEDEYIGDMFESSAGEEPDWVKKEREQFKSYRDKDGDGYLDEEEVAAWIIPADYDHSEAEAKHLIREADADLDGQLSKDEVLDKYDVFVGSQATNFGDDFFTHDEF